MSEKNLDHKGRWRCVTIAFRVSPEEAYSIDMKVKTSGLTKQDYCTMRMLGENILVRPNIRVQKYVCQYLSELTDELKRLEKIDDQSDDGLDYLRYLLDFISRLSPCE